MGALNPFQKPKMPVVQPADIYVPDATPVPERSSEETASLAEEQRRKFSSTGAGRSNTMLTGGAGAAQGTSAIRFLGGAART